MITSGQSFCQRCGLGVTSLLVFGAIALSLITVCNSDDGLPKEAHARLGTLRWRNDSLTSAVAFSANDSLVASYSHGGPLYIRAFPSGTKHSVYSCRTEAIAIDHKKATIAVMAVPVTDHATTRMWRSDLCIIDFATGKERYRLAANDSDVSTSVRYTAMVFTPNDESIACCGTTTIGDHIEGVIDMFDLDSKRRKWRARGKWGIQGSVCVSPHTSHLLVGGDDGILRALDIQRGTMVQTLVTAKPLVESLGYLADTNRIVALTSDIDPMSVLRKSAIEILDLKDDRRKLLLGRFNTRSHSNVAMSFDRSLLAMTSNDDDSRSWLRIWNVENGFSCRQIAMHDGPVAFSHRSHVVGIGGRNGVQFVNGRTGERLFSEPGHITGISGIAAGRDSKIFTVGSDGICNIWDLESGTLIKEIRGEPSCSFGIVPKVAVSHDGDFAVWGPEANKMHVVSTRDYKNVFDIPILSPIHVECRFSNDGRRIAIADEDHVAVFDLKSQKEMSTVDFPSSHIAFDANDSLLVGYFKGDATETTLNVYDVSKRESRKYGERFSSPKGAVLSRDSSQIAVLDEFGAALIDRINGKTVLRIRNHDNAITAICICPNSRLLGLGRRDGSVEVRELSRGGKGVSVGRHDGAIRSITFSHDGSFIISGGADTTAIIWDVRHLHEGK